MNQPVTPTGEVHPAADVFPMIEGDELEALVDSIREHGLTEPIWLTPDGVLLDGRNRLAACKQAGVTPTFRVYEGDDLVDFIVRLNIHRRHLTPGQLAMAGDDLQPLYEADAKTRQAHGATAPGRTLVADRPQASERAPLSRDRAAAAVGTSGRSVQRARLVKQQAPDLALQVRAGTMALSAAERTIRDRIAEAKRAEEAKEQAKQVKAGTSVDIRHGDFRDVLADLSGIDAIITDPPYPKEYLPLLDDLAAFADKVLTPDGILVVLFGQTHLPEVYERLSGGRPYRWTGCYLTPGPSYYSMARNVHTNWKPMLVYGGGDNFRDLVEAEGGDAGAKSLHHWGQDAGAFYTIVERLTKPGQTICDPFMGSGTTLAAARALGRHAIGCDVDAEHVATARERLGA